MQAIKVLLIEDNLELGGLLQEVLAEEIESVTWFVRARMDKENIVLMNADGKETVLSPSHFDVAMVDGRLSFSEMNGWDLTPKLVALGMRVFAMSGDTNINKQMVGLGAEKSVDKFSVYSEARKGTLVLKK